MGIALSLLGTVGCAVHGSPISGPLFIWAQLLAVLAVGLSMTNLQPVGGASVTRRYQQLRGVLFLSLLALSAAETAHLDPYDDIDDAFGALWVLGAALLSLSGVRAVQPPSLQNPE